MTSPGKKMVDPTYKCYGEAPTRARLIVNQVTVSASLGGLHAGFFILTSTALPGDKERKTLCTSLISSV